MLFKALFTQSVKSRVAPYCIVILLLATLWQWGQAAIIYGKAHLAQWLIQQAWQKTLATGNYTKPWSWADTWPVAQIVFPDNTHIYILSGSAGNSLAFGPGHVSSTALPGTQGSSVVGGHRDTHFSLLKNIHQGDSISIQNTKGQWRRYEVTNDWIADSRLEPLWIDNSQNSLYLVTCYPFSAIVPGGEQRFIVKAVSI